jgi:hypothetical protein
MKEYTVKINDMRKTVKIIILAIFCCSMANAGKKPFRAANISITGEWRIQVEYAGKTAGAGVLREVGSNVPETQGNRRIADKNPAENPIIRFSHVFLCKIFQILFL